MTFFSVCDYLNHLIRKLGRPTLRGYINTMRLTVKTRRVGRYHFRPNRDKAKKPVFDETTNFKILDHYSANSVNTEVYFSTYK